MIYAKSKFEGRYDKAIKLMKENKFDEAIEIIEFLYRNDLECLPKLIDLTKQMFRSQCYPEVGINFLKSIMESTRVDEDTSNYAQFELVRGLIKTRYFQAAYDMAIDLFGTSYEELAYVEIGRILSALGYKDEAKLAYSYVKDKERLDKISIEIGKINVVEKKFIAASNRFCPHVDDKYKKFEANTELMYSHLDQGHAQKAYSYLLEILNKPERKKADLAHALLYIQKMDPTLPNPGLNIKDDIFKKQLESYDPSIVRRRLLECLFDYNEAELIEGADTLNIFTYANAFVEYEKDNYYRSALLHFYAFDYKEPVVKIKGIPTSRIKVGVLPGTNNIISILAIPQLDDPLKFDKVRQQRSLK